MVIIHTLPGIVNIPIKNKMQILRIKTPVRNRGFRELGIQKPSSAPGVCGRRCFSFSEGNIAGFTNHLKPIRSSHGGSLFARCDGGPVGSPFAAGQKSLPRGLNRGRHERRGLFQPIKLLNKLLSVFIPNRGCAGTDIPVIFRVSNLDSCPSVS